MFGFEMSLVAVLHFRLLFVTDCFVVLSVCARVEESCNQCCSIRRCTVFRDSKDLWISEKSALIYDQPHFCCIYTVVR